MQRVPLGSSGIDVSRFCLGTMTFGWTADEAESFAILDAFAEAGGNFLDTADIYSRWVKGNWGGDSERIIGKWMAARGNRNEMVIATKCRGRMWKGPDGEGLSAAHIKRACRDSLRRLQVETIDLYQWHWDDENTPLEESLGAMRELIDEGKVRAFGVSNHPPAKLRTLLAAAAEGGVPVVALQPHHNMVHRKEYEEELAGICVENNIAVIPYSPLAKGFLTGKYSKDGPAVKSARSGGVRHFFDDHGWAVIDAVREVAAARNTTCSAVALAWELTKPGITAPIVGASTASQLADQLPALELELSAEDLAALDAASDFFRQRG